MAARMHFRSLFVTVVLVAMVLAVGPRDRVARAGDPAQEGLWGTPFDWGSPPKIPVHMTVLPDGRVLSWDNPGESRNDTPARVWSGDAPPTFTDYLLTGTDIFCSGHALMANGRVFVAGGNIWAGFEEHIGSDHANTFDFSTNQWAPIVPNMDAGRWYPTVTTLADGNLLVTSGDIRTEEPNLIPEVWQVSQTEWSKLTYAERNLTLYPWIYQAPETGKVFYAGENRQSLFLKMVDPGKGCSNGPRSSMDRSKGSSAMYLVTYNVPDPVAKVMIVGGALPNQPPGVSNTAQVINLKAGTLSWQSTQPMNNGRQDHNTTILADGTVFVSGGVNGVGLPVLVPEIYFDDNAVWSPMATAPTKRGYHSTAVLLPDGRVLTGGGVGQDASSKTAEIYSLPYLFKGPRPNIGDVQAVVNYGQTFRVSTSDAAIITKVTWIRLSSVTHGFNQNQRLLNLNFVRGQGYLDITPPSSATDSPPGHYLLFLVKGVAPNFVPSIGKIVQIQ